MSLVHFGTYCLARVFFYNDDDDGGGSIIHRMESP